MYVQETNTKIKKGGGNVYKTVETQIETELTTM